MPLVISPWLAEKNAGSQAKSGAGTGRAYYGDQPDDELVSIRRGPLVQMKDFQSMLKREGIPSIAVSEDSNCGQGSCATNLFVQIRKSDLQDVVAILERDHVRSTGLEDHDLSTAGAVIDTAAEQATCPACGYSFSTTEASCPDCGLCFG
ncbi:hypothetical protein VU11_05815 [Desulfobulbus sp. US2]|nr:hypothetical protein [Desulfobulbus sp. US2]